MKLKAFSPFLIITGLVLASIVGKMTYPRVAQYYTKYRVESVMEKEKKLKEIFEIYYSNANGDISAVPQNIEDLINQAKADKLLPDSFSSSNLFDGNIAMSIDNGILTFNSNLPADKKYAISVYKNKFKDENIKEILKQLEEKQKELKENEKFIHKYNGIFENLKNEKTQLETEISKLNNDIQELLQQKKCEIDKNKKTQLENQKIQLEKDFNIQKNELQNIEKKLKEEEGKKQIYIEHLEKNKKELTTLEDIDESVISDLEKLKQENRENNQKIGKLQEQIKYEEKILEELKNYFTQLQEKEEKIKPYEALNNLIGDAEGKRFREFAQTITFEYLLQLANQHLKTLNNRYVLKKEKNLDVVIIDKYHLNEQRLISSLSGGETFLVSLSLALALSDMISSQIGIKSFFIDEGFGSLDQNTLNTAFILLNKIQNSGKMVGIISHVETLKNEIPLQIKIESRNGVGKIKIDK